MPYDRRTSPSVLVLEVDRLPSAVSKAETDIGWHSDHMLAVRLMEHLVVPTFVLDASGRVMIWNRACERLTGISAAEVLGTKEHWRGFYESARPCLADLFFGGSVAELGTLYEDHVITTKGHFGMSAENWCAMPRIGSTRYLAIDAGPIYDDRGELLAVVETVRDMTAKKQAQIALEALASSDGLTGLANRRMFDKHLSQECRRARREGSPTSLLMIDIDYFKNYNDAFGHQRGDECLRMVASVIADQLLRPGDLAARYDGEEFAVILPSTPLAGGISVADRILIAVNAAGLPHPASPISNKVTVSIGVACGKSFSDVFDFIAAADAALYQAKRDGRDQVAAHLVRQHTEPSRESHAVRARRSNVSELRRATAPAQN